MLDVLKVAIEQVFHQVELDIFQGEGLEVIAFDMMRFELLKMGLEVVVEDLGSHLALEPRPLIEVIEYLLLEINEALILTCHLQLHQVLRDQLLRVDVVEELDVRYQVPRRFLSILELSELDNKYVLQLLEVLLHVVDAHSSRAVELYLFDFGVKINPKRINLLLKFLELIVALVHEELVVEESGFVIVHVFGEVTLREGVFRVDTTYFVQYTLLVILMHVVVLLQLCR
jgi:hypothetical protein